MNPQEVTPEILNFLKENIETNFNITDGDKLEIMKRNIYAEFGEPYPEYDRFGLRFSLDHLECIKYVLPLSPVQIAADYVDIVTKTAVDNNEMRYEDSFLKDIEDAGVSINATAIGNLSYAYLHTTYEEDKPLLKAALIKIAKFILEQAEQELN